ncbi:MAG: DNA translocase FtsK, partial [Planctomycetes bacterium]|nr:DNA translocase FtsK [Planctomycetota bacterium]
VESGLSSSLQSASSAIGDLENTLKSTPPASPEIVDTGHSHDVVSDLLDKQRVKEVRAEEETIQHNARVLEQTLQDFKIEARVVGYTRGPVVTMFEIALAAGTKVTRIHALADDLSMALKAQTVRVVAPIPGKSTVGVEVPNLVREDVRLRGLLETETFQRSKAHLPLLLGVDAGGAHRIEDLAAMPHLLIAGATGSGKSVCINSIIMSFLMCRTPDDVRLILVDPKQVELSFFSRIPHLLSPVVTDMKRAVNVLEWAVNQMEERYDLLALMQVRSIASYNELGPKAIKARLEELEDTDREVPPRLPYVVIVVDELADLMMTAGKDIEVLITRLAQKSRAVGIHVVLATQRPSTDVITGLIKANMPTRICFKVTSKVDSRVVMDQNGGDRLLGQGDMLYLPPRTASLIRAQATFVSDAEVKRVVEFLAGRHEPQFNRELTQVCTGALLSEDEKDELYDQAVRVVLEEQRGSASLLQRALEIGYTRASRLLDLMRKEGIVGAYKGSKASEVVVTLEEYEARVAAARAAAAEEDEVEE